MCIRDSFISLYLGLRRMGDRLAALDSNEATPAREIEQFMDELLRKTHRPEPFVVLTAPFGGSTSPTAPYSTRTGETAPGRRHATNTWRNNFGIQKGVGCPADPETIRSLLRNPSRRLACPHMATDPDDQHLCSLESTTYRGEEHSIWLRKTSDGWQTVDLNDPAVYGEYLSPNEERVPVFPLIAVLYCDAPAHAYPERDVIGIPDFATDFGFSVEQVTSIFNCDPNHGDNAVVLRVIENQQVSSTTIPVSGRNQIAEQSNDATAHRGGQPLPELGGAMLANSGLGAELAVADDLAKHGWHVLYRGSQAGVGYDLEASQEGAQLCVEVKSSVGFTTPELSDSEWNAAQKNGDEFVLAIVDFYGSQQQAIWYVRHPVAVTSPTERTTTIYRLNRSTLEEDATGAEFL